MESQGLALPAFARNSLGQFFPTVQYCMDHFRSGPPSDGTCLNYAILALQATQGWAGDMSVPPHARLWGKYNEFSLITKYHRPVTAGHTGSSQASMPPDTNPDDLPDPAPDFFVGASEPMFEGPSFWFPDQPLPELSPSFADLPSSALNEPQIFPQVEGCWNEPVPETPSSSTASSAAAEHKCSSCGKVKPERDFSLREGRLAATCEQCRAIRRQYYKGNANSNSTPPTTQRCTACHEERPIEDFDATATHSRKCRRCRGEGRPVAPAPNTSPRRVSKRSQMPQEPGKTRCSGCGKAQENRLFFNYKYNPPHKRSTCSPCRQRKQETDRRKRERREVEE